MNTYSVSMIIKAVDQVTGPLKQIRAAINGVTQTSQMKALRMEFQRVGQSIANVGHEASLFGQRMVGVGAATAGLFVAFGKPAMELENLRFRLDALYESADKGKQKFDWLMEFAVKSPYSFAALADSLATLKGQGFDNVPQFENLMNFMATRVPDSFRAQNAVLAFSQAWGLGKLQAQDMRQIVNAGIPIYKLLGETLGVTTEKIQDMSKAGTIGRKEMMKLFAIMGKKSGSGVGAIGNLMETKLSNLGDVWQQFTYKVMNTDLGGLTVFQTIKNDVQQFTDFLKNGFSGDTGKQFAQTLADIYAVTKDVVAVVMEIAQPIVGVMKWLSKLIGVRNVIKLLIAAMAVPVVISFVAAIASIITAAATIGPVLATIGGAIAALVGPTTAAFLAFSALIAAPWLALIGFLGTLIFNWKAVTAAISGAYKAFREWIKQDGRGAFDAIFTLIEQLADIFKILGTNIFGAAKNLASFLGMLPGAGIQGFEKIADKGKISAGRGLDGAMARVSHSVNGSAAIRSRVDINFLGTNLPGTIQSVKTKGTPVNFNASMKQGHLVTAY